MNLSYNSDERMLENLIQSFADDKLSFDHVSKWRNDPQALFVSVWPELADIGILSIYFDELDGGLGLGLPSLVIAQEALGATLAPMPMISTIMLSGQLLKMAGSAELKAAWLPRIMAGEAILSFAHFEPAMRFERSQLNSTLRRWKQGFVLNGTKSMVLDGPFADAFVITGVVDEGRDRGISAVIVPANAEGVIIKSQQLIDGRSAAQVTFSDVVVPDSALIGDVGGLGQTLELVFDRATLALCGEMVGGMQRAFDMTVAYLGEREQFGVKIGSFQALQHRAARMFTSISLARPAVRAAAIAAEREDEAESRQLVSLAKALCSDGYNQIASEAVQMHGGIGMTEEFPVGHYLRAAKVCEMLFGDSSWHRSRWAELRGY